MFVLILRFKINAFLALISAATLVGVLAPGIPFASIMPKVAESFGTVAGKIGIIVALAAVVGECLLESGSADKITRVAVRLLGEKRASLSLLGTGYVLAIPVFFDTVFYLLIPLARAMGIRSKGKYLLFVMSICAGAICTQCLVPPTPGPLAMAATLGIDMGAMILGGMVIAIPMAFAGWLFAIRQNRLLDLPLRETPGVTLAELEKISLTSEDRLPHFVPAMLPILLPVLLITSNTLVNALWPGSPAGKAAAFFGDANFALLVSAAVSLLVLARHKRYNLKQLAATVERGFGSAGLIILITAAGGAFGAMLVLAGAGTALGGLAARYHMPLLLMGFCLGGPVQGRTGFEHGGDDHRVFDHGAPAGRPPPGFSSGLPGLLHRFRRHAGGVDERQRVLDLQTDVGLHGDRNPEDLDAVTGGDRHHRLHRLRRSSRCSCRWCSVLSLLRTQKFTRRTSCPLRGVPTWTLLGSMRPKPCVTTPVAGS